MVQLSLFDDGNASHIVSGFSAGSLCDDSERQKLEDRYRAILTVTDKYSRRSVSYQLNKKDGIHSWLKYKEGFSAELVNILLDEMGIKTGNLVMDPFSGSGTTLVVCQSRRINSIGYDIMPVSSLAVNVKSYAMKYSPDEVKALLEEFSRLSMPEDYSGVTPYITITESAYPEHNRQFIQYASDWIKHSDYSTEAKNLFILCIVNSLERCSYTVKNGQYLSWDSRSQKVIDANRERMKTGRKLLPENFCREKICDVQEAVIDELKNILDDIISIQAHENMSDASIDFRQGSSLFGLLELDSGIVDGVITSPPYCNRYDYTRTYALELVYLGMNENGIKAMRQNLLSCTVESKSKIEALRDFYYSHGKNERFDYILNVTENNKVLREIIVALYFRKSSGELNNNGIIRMIEGYFMELSFIFAELYRLCKKGAYIAFVNDNVRYGGEVIPVDFMSADIAESFGFTAERIYCIKQQKGNSSQQMKKYGRVPLRKSIILCRK